jgi:hypothetical protein
VKCRRTFGVGLTVTTLWWSVALPDIARAAATATSASATSATAKTSSNTDQKVSAIRADVAAINRSLPKYRKTTLIDLELSAEGAEATYHVSGTSIRKIDATIYGETQQAKIAFYFKSGQLIFAFDQRSFYEGGLGSPIARKEERRLYFIGGVAIRVLIGTTPLPRGDEEFGPLVEQIQELSQGLRKSYEE